MRDCFLCKFLEGREFGFLFDFLDLKLLRRSSYGDGENKNENAL
jgi:hypothetical protein